MQRKWQNQGVHFTEVVQFFHIFMIPSRISTRRHFLGKIAVSAALPAFWCGQAFAQTPPAGKLEETDPMATAIGYKKDTTKVVASKYPTHKADQKCNNCGLYQGKPGDANGACLAVGGKLVAVAGWCSVWAKKPDPAKP